MATTSAVAILAKNTVVSNATTPICHELPQPAIAASALWALIALAINAMTQRSGADRFRSKDVNIASPELDIRVCGRRSRRRALARPRQVGRSRRQNLHVLVSKGDGSHPGELGPSVDPGYPRRESLLLRLGPLAAGHQVVRRVWVTLDEGVGRHFPRRVVR